VNSRLHRVARRSNSRTLLDQVLAVNCHLLHTTNPNAVRHSLASMLHRMIIITRSSSTLAVVALLAAFVSSTAPTPTVP
jgi:hypothetical protein